jgi:hypothetical protein
VTDSAAARLVLDHHVDADTTTTVDANRTEPPP